MNSAVQVIGQGETLSLSVVIPVFNEEDVLPELYRRVVAVLEGLGKSFEIILVDDGSRDRSWEIITGIHETDPRVKGIRFSRNFGHHIAITAGLDNANGDAVVLMDGDLQDPPEEIPNMYGKHKEGYDVVYAIREVRNDPPVKKAMSWIFNQVLKRISNVEICLHSGIFRILSRRCVLGMRDLRERSRFIVGMINWIGYPQTGVNTVRHSRYAGSSKYSLFKLFRLAWHGLTSFSYLPLQFATYFGFLVSFVTFVMGIYMLLKKVFWGIPLLGYASIVVSLFFIGGVILLVLGVVGEYIGRIYTEVQNRPIYVVGESVGIDRSGGN